MSMDPKHTNLRRWTLRALLALLVALPATWTAVEEAEAGAPRLSWRYRDRVHKFSLAMFDEYKPVPLKTDEKITLCKFRDPDNKGQNRGTYDPEIEVLKIVHDDSDEPVTTGGGMPDGPPDGPMDAEKLREMFERMRRPKTIWDATLGKIRLTDESKKKLERYKKKFRKIESDDDEEIPGRFWKFTVEIPGWSGNNEELFVSMAAFRREQTSMVIFMTCGEPLEKHFKRPFYHIAKSFKWHDDKAEDVESLEVLDGINITPKKRLEIERSMVKGWNVIVSPKKNYIVIYNTKNNKNHRLAQVIAERIEMIREQIYEEQFPPSKPIETVCIVRVCGDRSEYHSYGGPPGSAGYWSSGDEELVFYDASASKSPDDDTLSVLYHEAFHQYIYYSVGNVAPHSWFNEGHGDYYAGAELKGRRFVIEPFRWRVGTVRNAIVEGPREFTEVEGKDGKVRKKWGGKGYTPLKDLVRFSQRDYYAYPGVSYAQGWSLIYFLREIVPRNRHYRKKWGHILDTYFDVLQREVNKNDPLVRGGDLPEDGDDKDGDDEGEEDGPPAPPVTPGDGGDEGEDGDEGDEDGGEEPPGVARVFFRGRGGPEALEKAVTEAFKGVDWEEFEEAWIRATK